MTRKQKQVEKEIRLAIIGGVVVGVLVVALMVFGMSIVSPNNAPQEPVGAQQITNGIDKEAFNTIPAEAQQLNSIYTEEELSSLVAPLND